MRLKTVLGGSILAAFVAALSVGCSNEVPITPAPAPTPAPPQELPKDPKKGGGPTSSGNSKTNPMEDRLAPK